MQNERNATSLKILWTCPYLPWPTIGGNKLRVYNLLRGLAARGHRITFLVHCSQEPDPLALEHLSPMLERLLVVRRRRRLHPITLATAALAPYPVDVCINGFSRQLRNTMCDLLEEPWDVVQVEHGYALHSFLSLLIRRHQPFVLTEHNVESTLVKNNDYHPRVPHIFLRSMHRFDGWRYRRWERHVFAAPIRVIAVTSQDAATISAIAKRPVDVIANGADTAGSSHVQADPTSRRIMFIGNHHYFPNADAVHWAVTDIMPRVWSKVPDAEFIVCGAGMDPEWRVKWPDPRIVWQGFVADITAVQAECCAFIAPLRSGGGSKLKVLEAMAAGLAVVSTDEGVSGLTALPGRDFLLGNTALALADCLVTLLGDTATTRDVGAAGRRYVIDQHGWPALTKQLENIYLSLPLRAAPQINLLTGATSP